MKIVGLKIFITFLMVLPWMAEAQVTYMPERFYLKKDEKPNEESQEIIKPVPEIPIEKVDQEHLRNTAFWQGPKAADTMMALNRSNLEGEAIKELNIRAAQIWEDIRSCYSGNLSQFREDYRRGRFACPNLKPEIQELYGNLFQQLITKEADLILSYKNLPMEFPHYSRTRDFSMHPLLSQFMSQMYLQVAMNYQIYNYYKINLIEAISYKSTDTSYWARRLADHSLGRMRQAIQIYQNATLFTPRSWIIRQREEHDAETKRLEQNQERINASVEPLFKPFGKNLIFLWIAMVMDSKSGCEVFGLFPMENLNLIQYTTTTFELDSGTLHHKSTVSYQSRKKCGHIQIDRIESPESRGSINYFTDSIYREIENLHAIYFPKFKVENAKK